MTYTVNILLFLFTLTLSNFESSLVKASHNKLFEHYCKKKPLEAKDDATGSYYNSNTYEDTSYYDDVSREEKKATTKWYEEPEHAVKVKYIKQHIDQFNHNQVSKWYQKIFQNTGFWKPNSPIYIYVGGNKALNESILMEGLMYEIAEETGGVLFAIEHRYYGNSKTFYEIDYLHSSQALEDIKDFITAVKNEKEYIHSKVVLVGGGYGGSLAVWTKVAWPTKAEVVLASSAPLWARATFEEHILQMKDNFEKYAPRNCTDNVSSKVQLFYFCEKEDIKDCLYINQPICNHNNFYAEETRGLYFHSLFALFYEAAEKGIREMHKICKRLRNGELYNWQMPLFWNKEKRCNDFSLAHFINTMNSEKFRDNKLWLYQCCNEFGFFKITSTWYSRQVNITYDISPLIPLRNYLGICGAFFGAEFVKETPFRDRVEATNKVYGGPFPNVTNVIFTQGTLDPWKDVGVKEPLSKGNVFKKIQGAAHCRDLLPKNRTDPRPIRQARKEIISSVKYMLGAE